MLASLRYLAGDDAQAKEAIERAAQSGDSAASTRNLRLTIDRRLAEKQREQQTILAEDTVPDPPPPLEKEPAEPAEEPAQSNAPRVAVDQEFCPVACAE